MDWAVPQLSASSVNLFLSCPEKWRQERILGIRTPETARQVYGTVMHGVIDKALSALQLDGERMSLEDMHGILDYKVDVLEVSQQEIVFDDLVTDLEALVWSAKLALFQFHNEFLPVVRQEDILGVEERFEMIVDGVPVPVVGVIDLRGDGWVTDWKTSAGKTVYKVPQPEWLVQGEIYSLAAKTKMMLWGQIRSHTIAHPMIGYERLVQYTDPERARTLLRQAADEIDLYWNRYGPDNPWPVKGRWANQCWKFRQPCPFMSDCPAWSRPE